MEGLNEYKSLKNLKTPVLLCAMHEVSTQILEFVQSDTYISEQTKATLVVLVERLSDHEKEALVAQLVSLLQRVGAMPANAVFVLGLVGPQARSAVPKMVNLLSHWNSKLVIEVAQALPKIGAKHAIPALAAALRKAPEPSKSRMTWTITDSHIIECVQAFGPAAVEMAPQIAAYLHCTDWLNQELINIGTAAIPSILEQLTLAVSNEKREEMLKNAVDIFLAMGKEKSISELQELEKNFGQSKQQELKELAKEALSLLQSRAADKSGLSPVDLVLNAVHNTWDMSLQAQAKLATLLSDVAESDKHLLVEPLIAVLPKWVDNHVSAAIYVLGLLGPVAKPAVPALINGRERMSSNGVMLAAEALRKIDLEYSMKEILKVVPAAPALDVSHYSGFSYTDQHLLRWLEMFGTAAGGAATYLASWLRTSDTIAALINIGDAAISAVLAEVKRANKTFAMSCVSKGAGVVLTGIGSSASRPLIEMLESSSPDMLEAISIVFSNLQPPALSADASTALSKLLSGKNQRTQSNAKRALVALGGEAAADAYEHLIKHRPKEGYGHQHMDYQTRNILKEFGEDAVPSLKARMLQSDTEMQAYFATAILHLSPNDDDAFATLVSLLEHEDEEVRIVTLQSITFTNTNEKEWAARLEPALIKVWQDPSGKVRQQAAGVITALQYVLPDISSRLMQSVRPAVPASDRKEEK